MPLPQPQNIPVIFEGLDTFTDPQRGVQTKLDLLENGYVSTPMKIQKRPGYSAYGVNIDGGGNISAGAKLMGYRNQLLMSDGTTLYTKNAVAGAWTKRGKVPSGQISVERVTQDTLTTSRLNVTGAYAAGVRLLAWQPDKSIAILSWQTIDTSTGALLGAGSVNGAFPKAVSCGGFIFLVAMNTGPLIVYKLNPAAPTVLSAPTTIVGASVGNFDVAGDTATPQVLVASYDGTTTQVSIRAVSTSLAVTGPVLINKVGGGAAGPMSWLLHDWSNGTGYLAITWVNGTVLYNINTATLANSNIVIADASATTGTTLAVTGYALAGARTVFMERYNSSTADINFINGSAEGVIFELVRSCGLSSKVFKNGARYYVALFYEDSTQRHRYLLEYEDGTKGANGGTAIVGYLGAKDDGGACGGPQGASTPIPSDLPEAISYGSGAFDLPGQYSFDLGAHYGVTCHKVTFGEAGVGVVANYADSLFIPGMQLNAYDGAQCVEQGFYVKPQAPALAAGAGGSLVNGGVYLVKMVHKWTDSRGRIWRSEAGPSASFTVGATQSIQVTAKTLRITNKAPKFSQTASCPAVALEAYRTINGGSTYYLDNSGTNTVTADTVVFSLTQSDATLATQDLLYQQSGVLGNETPPAVRLVWTYGTRLFGCSYDGDIWHTKDLAEGEGAAFSSTFRIPLDTSAGQITALFDMDSAFYMGQRTGVFVLGGGDPTDTGQNLFSQPTRVNTTIGPVDQASVVRVPDGVAYNSARGLHVFTRGLASSFIGQAVQRYTQADAITGASTVDNTNQVRWTTSSGDLLVYDYAIGQWYVWTGLAAVACALYQNVFTILSSAGVVKVETAGAFNDDGVPIVLKLRTGWLSLAGLAGYQRLWEVNVVGQSKGAHTLSMSFAYNFSTFINETITANAGAATYNTGIEGGYVWSAQPKQQLCTSVQITINDVLAGAGSEGFYLTGIALLCGVLAGSARMPSAKSLQ